MSNWKETTLGEIAEIIMGQSPPGIASNGNKAGAPLLNGPTEFGSCHPVPIQYTTDPRRFSEVGDILFCVRGSTTGRMNWSDQKYAIGRGLAAIRHKYGYEYQPFLKGMIDYYLPTLLSVATGSTFPNVSRNDIAGLKCLAPGLKEQKRIAEILGSLDDKIELNRKQNETLEAMARAVFQSWFVDFDPVIDNALAAGRPIPDELAEKAARRKHHKTKHPLPQAIQSLFPNRFEPSPIGPIPKGWIVKSLFDTATFVNGSSFQSTYFCKPSEGLPIIKIAELKNGISNQTNYTTQTLDVKYSVDTGDMFYSWSGSPDTSLDVFLWTGGPGWLNQHIFKVITADEAEKVFEYFLLRHLRDTLVEIARDKQTTGLGHVTISDMKRLHIVCSEDPLLELYHKISGPVFNQIFTNLLESKTLTQLRDSLLPKLLTGEIEVCTEYRIKEF